MNVNIILFDDFETLDAFGPAQVFGMAPQHFYVNYFSMNGGIVTSAQGAKVWTEPLNPVEVEDILVLPGGKGARRLLCLKDKSLEWMKGCDAEADLCLMVANGSALLAQTGALYHRRIADYVGDENWKRMFLAGLTRVPGVRWMSDGKYYSCSSTAQSVEMALGVMADAVDVELAERTAASLGCQWDWADHEGVLR